METSNAKEYLRKYVYLFLIGILSLMAIVVFPILGSTGNDYREVIKTAFPDSTLGWVFWAIVRGMIIFLNIMIFSNFIQQGKLNILEHPSYKKAVELLQKNKSKLKTPKSEAEFMATTYAKKGSMLILTSGASLFAIGSAILNYDYMLLISISFTVAMSIVFGIMEMKKVELYFTTEYLNYAENINKENNNDNSERCGTSELAGAGGEEQE